MRPGRADLRRRSLRGGRDERSFLARLRDGFDDFARSSPSRFAILVFTSLITILALLLATPWAARDRQPTDFADALFTAVSAICVTGLTTVDMSTHWSTFGNVAILIGLQVGGIGVLTLASILGLVVSRRLGLRQRLIAASDTNPARSHAGPVSESQAVRLGEIGGLLATVALSALIIEVILMLALIPRLLLYGLDPWGAIWKSFYFAASAFTNTGFVPTEAGVEPFATDPWFLAVIAFGVFLGSLGFPVIFALLRWAKSRARLSLHVKLTLVTTIGLLFLGAIAIGLLEWDNPQTLGSQTPWFRPVTALFTSFMTRSGGFSTIDIDQTDGSTKLVMDMLMFVGGGSASTAGGIKVTTLAVLFLAAFAEAKGDNDMQVFERRIPVDVLRLAVSVVLWGATIVATSSIIILRITHDPLDRVLFDVISAFATCGLSTGLTESLPDAGKYVLAATMWAGRVGTVTLAAALAAAQRRQLYTRAEERPIVG
ncbi:MAG: TrkH family potassium uptake protein [Actinomycetales bacterium]|nr:TrkH family potassium uptake protein [Actinomycetales bacterium]